MVDISRDEGVIQVEVHSHLGPPSSADFKLTVPAWLDLKLSGVYCDIHVTGTRGTLEAETVQGDVEVTGGEGHISVQSVQGSVTVTGANGKIETSSVQENVEVIGASGDLTAETVNGTVTIRKSRLDSFEASTVQGTLIFDGEFQKNGRYEMSTHNGSVYVAIPVNADLAIEASTYSGSFEATFPMEKERENARRKRYNVRFGAGSAQLSLESFQGSIVLHRPGERVAGASYNEDSSGAKSKDKTHLKNKPGKHDSDSDSDEDRDPDKDKDKDEGGR